MATSGGSIGQSKRVSDRLAVAGMFTATWDTVAAVDIGGRTVKLSLVLFLASLGARVLSGEIGALRISRPVRLLAIGVLVLLLRGLFGTDIGVSLVAAAAYVGTGFIPFLAVLLAFAHAASLVRSFVWGCAFVSVYAVYEFGARLAGLPVPTTPNIIGSIAGFPRAAGFAFEPAFFAAPAAVALLLVLFRWPSSGSRPWLVGVLAAGVAATNARVVFLLVPVGTVLVVALTRRSDQFRARAKRRALRGALVLALLGVGVFVATPDAIFSIASRAASIFDPHEYASNAVRLQLYAASWDVFLEAPIGGHGVGSLGAELIERGIVDPTGGPLVTEWVANNVWLQAAVDGGIIAVVLQAALVVSVLGVARRTTGLASSVLALWLGYLLVAGSLVSIFWDTETCVLLAAGLGLAYSDLDDRDHRRAAAPARRSPWATAGFAPAPVQGASGFLATNR